MKDRQNKRMCILRSYSAFGWDILQNSVVLTLRIQSWNPFKNGKSSRVDIVDYNYFPNPAEIIECSSQQLQERTIRSDARCDDQRLALITRVSERARLRSR